MTELETMQRAKMYLDKLAQGIDPFTDQEIPENSTLNNVRLARCFFYVSGVLGKVIENGGVVGHKAQMLEFSMTPEQIACVKICDYPVRITEFTNVLYQAVNNPEMKRLSAVKITEWLVSKGLMVKEPGPDGKIHRVPSGRGLQMGMSTQLRQSRNGEYRAVYYDQNMQKYLLDNLPGILAEK